MDEPLIFGLLKGKIKMHGKFMKEALSLAQKAYSEGEVPVGAVIVKDGEIIATGCNKTESSQNALSHAEIEAINSACKALCTWRLNGCTLYVTLEPCPMCTGAIINSRIERVVFGAYDERCGCMGSVTDLCQKPFFSKPAVIGGYMEKECKGLLCDFFEKLR